MAGERPLGIASRAVTIRLSKALSVEPGSASICQSPAGSELSTRIGAGGTRAAQLWLVRTTALRSRRLGVSDARRAKLSMLRVRSAAWSVASSASFS